MAATSAIEWTDATVNFWWGCTKVGPGCDHCYAETWSKRMGGDHWGVGVLRRKIKGARALIHKLDNGYSWWAADHYIGGINPTPARRVFIQSMSDLFDTEVPLEWFAEGWDLIERCDRLEIQIVTKRISVVEKRLAAIGRTAWPKHAGLIISVVNQDEADRDIPRLLALKKKLGIPWVGLSMEPLLGAVDLTRILMHEGDNDPALAAKNGIQRIRITINALRGVESFGWSGIDWIIVGGESGPKARPLHPDWVRSIRDQCAAAGVPFLFKQWGGHSYDYDRERDDPDWRRCGDTVRKPGQWINLAGGTGFHGERVHYAQRVGKKAAGRLLDGVEHNGLPTTAAVA